MQTDLLELHLRWAAGRCLLRPPPASFAALWGKWKRESHLCPGEPAGARSREGPEGCFPKLGCWLPGEGLVGEEEGGAKSGPGSKRGLERDFSKSLSQGIKRRNSPGSRDTRPQPGFLDPKGGQNNQGAGETQPVGRTKVWKDGDTFLSPSPLHPALSHLLHSSA